MAKNIGFISFRISGTDGVSIETLKWAEIFEKNGHKCFYIAGELDLPGEECFAVPELHFQHPEIKRLYKLAYYNANRPRERQDHAALQLRVVGG